MSDTIPGVMGSLIGGMPVEVAQDFNIIYSNLFRYRLTHNELALIFSTISDPHGGLAPAVIMDRVQLMMSLPQAKALLEYLTLLLGTYEQEFGPIRAAGRNPPTRDEIEGIFTILRTVGTH